MFLQNAVFLPQQAALVGCAPILTLWCDMHVPASRCLPVIQCLFAPPLSCLIIMAPHGTRACVGEWGCPALPLPFLKPQIHWHLLEKEAPMSLILAESPEGWVQAALPVGFPTFLASACG